MKKIVFQKGNGVGIINATGDPESIAIGFGISEYKLVEESDFPSAPFEKWIWDADSPTGISVAPDPEFGSEQWKVIQRNFVEAKKALVLKSGTPWNGRILFTDDDGWKALAGALLATDLIPEDGIPDWHFVDGDGVVLSSDLQSMKQQFFAHTLGCQAVRTAKLALIEAGQDPDINNGWPSNA